MAFTLGSVIVRGGKVMGSGYNHQRTRYEEDFSRAHNPVSMHAEMHTIFNLSGGKGPPNTQHVQARIQCINQPESQRSSGALEDPHVRMSISRVRHHGRIESDRRSVDDSSVEAGKYDRGAFPWPTRLPLTMRLPRLNGAELYVVRTTKMGLTCAKPCWRCIEWCRWAGIKRVFYWDPQNNNFRCIKVSDMQLEHYQTQAEQRLAARQSI